MDKNAIIQLEDWQIEAFAGQNSQYYKKVWTKYQKPNSAGLNWVAFFFQFIWFVYRRMYKEAIIGFILVAVINTVMGKLFASSSGAGSSVAIMLIYGMMSNVIYRKKLLTILQENEGKNQAEIELALAQKGGTNKVATIVISLLLIVVIVVGVLATLPQ